MAKDLVYLSALCHEDSRYSSRNLTPITKVNNLLEQTEGSSEPKVDPTTGSTARVPSATIRRARSLVSMYSTSVVFPQNRVHHLKSLQFPLHANTGLTSTMNSLSAEDRLRLMTRLGLVGAGTGMTSAGEHMRTLAEVDPEHAASLFALVV